MAKTPLYECQECGKKFYTTAAAQRATNKGCKCGGYDIDLYVPKVTTISHSTPIKVRFNNE
jgi:hypothetical protein